MKEPQVLHHTFIPELGIPQRGKVRDIYDQDNNLTMIASDRISVFDIVLPQPIRDKGRVLTELSRYWFQQTEDIIPNHILSQPDPNILIVKKCFPLKVEMIVRSYLVGSLWRDYRSGKRTKCGITLPDGLKENDALPEPIITPTTKSLDSHDEDITKEELITNGIVTKDQWEEMARVSLALFERGQEIAEKKGLILIDTKYEFGLDKEGNLILIDEIHTPDSSRYWFKKDQEVQEVKFPDKEFAREWARSQGFIGQNATPPQLPDDIREKIREGYRNVYETLTGQPLEQDDTPVNYRVLNRLKEQKIIKGVFCLILAGSEKDQPHIDKITHTLTDLGIPNKTIIRSAHKSPQQVVDLINLYNDSLEPLVCITVAGRSNALSGLVAANLRWPVIACPPFKDHSDYLTNIHSSLQMPSNVPAMTVIDPKNAALATERILRSMEQN